MNIKSIVAFVAVLAMLGSTMTSCSYDDSKIRQEIENIKDELAQLRASVESELAALRALIEGQVTVKSVKTNDDGSKVITLSDDTTFTVYPKGDKVPSQIVTIVNIDGVKYWAMYDARGNAQPIVVKGEYVAVADVAPQTRVNGEAIEVSFDGGETWLTTGYTASAADSIIANIEVVYSDWQTDAEGNPLALYCQITLVDGSVVKTGMQNGKLVLPYDVVFAAYETTTPFMIEVDDAADFMIIDPMGWNSDVEHNVVAGTMLLNFTAPSAADVKAGVAVDEGVVKFVVVFNNGSSAMASIKLSTKPATVNFTPKGAIIDAAYGANYLLCGMVAANQYNADAVARECNAQLAAPSSNIDGVVQISFTEAMSKFVSFDELVKGELKGGVEYTFWFVAPTTNAEGDLVVSGNQIVAISYKVSDVSFKVVDKSFFDVNIEFEVVGSEPYALGYALASEFDAKELATYYTSNPSYLNAKHEDMSYNGSFVELFAEGATKLESGARYVAWYLAKSANDIYLEDNILSWEFATMEFNERGDIEIVAGDAVCDYGSVEVELDTEEPHMMIYYNAMLAADAAKYSDDDSIIEMLVSKGTKVDTESSVVVRYECASGDKVVVFAVAIDKAGKIGKPFKAEYATKVIEYNELIPTLEVVEAVVTNTVIKVACDGAKSYKYIYTPSKGSEWTTVYGGSDAAAGEYIIKNPTNANVYEATGDSITIAGLVAGTEYVMVVLAEDAFGLMSQPVSIKFTPIANVDGFVYKDSAAWSMGKPELLQCAAELYGHDLRITWYILPQKDCTAYSVAISPAWLEEEGCQTPEDVVKYILSQVDKGIGSRNERGRTCEYREDGNYSRTWINQIEDVNGDGVFNFDDMVEMSEDGLPGVYNICPCGTKDETMIYTTWQDQNGNFHEPFIYDPTNKKYVD